MLNSLNGIASRARSHRKHQFGNLYGELNEPFLADSYHRMNPKATPGIDGVDYRSYGEKLTENIHDVVDRLKQKRYRAKLIRRRNIPKGKGKTRPLGILIMDDKVVQTGAARLLSAIWEADFLDCSHAYRPKRNAHGAIRELTDKMQKGKYRYVVEADIHDYFGMIQHDWMVKMLELRIKDNAFIRLIQKWLRARILEEDGKITDPVTGTPQGGVVSAVLANIYLHYALDLWFKLHVKPRCRGEAMMIRYADDFVCLFQHEADAQQFYAALPQRLEKFGLHIAPEKTRVQRFSRFEPQGTSRIEFLGFEFRWGKSRAGKTIVKRRTAPKRLTKAIAKFTEWIKENRHQGLSVLMRKLRTKYQGTWNYFGLIGNYRSLRAFYHWTIRILHKWLNRRSQRRSYTWKQLEAVLLKHHIPRPRITERPASRYTQLGFQWNWC